MFFFLCLLFFFRFRLFLGFLLFFWSFFLYFLFFRLNFSLNFTFLNFFWGFLLRRRNIILLLRFPQKLSNSSFSNKLTKWSFDIPSIMSKISSLHERAVELLVQINPYFLIVPELTNKLMLFLKFILNRLLIFMYLIDFLHVEHLTWFCNLSALMVTSSIRCSISVLVTWVAFSLCFFFDSYVLTSYDKLINYKEVSF